MTIKRRPFQNFEIDHMTMLLAPEMYNAVYVMVRVIFGCAPEDIVYNVRKKWTDTHEESLTYAVCLGESKGEASTINKTLVAFVQPSEPKGQYSHVAETLKEHNAAAHWQHLALRTPDLLAFHKHAVERGVRFITPILKDAHDDLIQVFSGEWYFPGSPASGLFFEFVQREVTPELLKMLEQHNRESFFRDHAFLGLYGEKDKEMKRGKAVPFLDHTLFEKIVALVGKKKNWEITEADIAQAEKMMLAYAKEHPAAVSV